MLGSLHLLSVLLNPHNFVRKLNPQDVKQVSQSQIRIQVNAQKLFPFLHCHCFFLFPIFFFFFSHEIASVQCGAIIANFVKSLDLGFSVHWILKHHCSNVPDLLIIFSLTKKLEAFPSIRASSTSVFSHNLQNTCTFNSYCLLYSRLW